MVDQRSSAFNEFCIILKDIRHHQRSLGKEPAHLGVVFLLELNQLICLGYTQNAFDAVGFYHHDKTKIVNQCDTPSCCVRLWRNECYL